MSEEQQTEGTRVYDRLVGVDAEGRLPPVVAAQLKGDPGDPGQPGPPGEHGPAGEPGKTPTLTWDGTTLLIDGEPGPDLAAPTRPGVTAEQFLSQETFTIAHRGSGDVFPEHTLEAYRGSVAQGAKAVEVSVRVTADGVPVCIHDDSLARTTGVEASVAELTLAELQAITVLMGRYLGAGSPVTRVPTLDEALHVLAGHAVVFLEPKVASAVAPVLAAVKEWGIAPSTVFKTYRNGAGGYGESSVLQRVKAAGMTTWCYVDAGDALEDIKTLAGHADMIGVPFFGDVDKDAPSSMPREKIKQVTALGKPVIAWEVHRLADKEMLAGLGVRGFMSPQWALLAGDLTPRKATRFSSRQRVAGEQIGPDNTVGWAPSWDGVDLVMDQTWDASYCLGRFATGPSYTLRASWAWTSNTPTAGGTHAGIVFGASNDEAWGFGPKHRTSTSGSYLLIRRGDGRITLLKYTPGATGGVALGELKGPKPADGVPLKVAVEVTPEQLRVTATGVDGEIVSTDTDYRGPFIHLARNHGRSAGGSVAYGDVVVS